MKSSFKLIQFDTAKQKWVFKRHEQIVFSYFKFLSVYVFKGFTKHNNSDNKIVAITATATTTTTKTKTTTTATTTTTVAIIATSSTSLAAIVVHKPFIQLVKMVFFLPLFVVFRDYKDFRLVCRCSNLFDLFRQGDYILAISIDWKNCRG